MKIWSVFSLVIVFHLAVIGVLLIQPGCQSQSAPPPDPSMTTPGTGLPLPEPMPSEPLDPAFNAGMQSAGTPGGRTMSAPRRPTGVTRSEPDTSTLQPVLEPVQDDLSLPTIQQKYTVQKGDNLTMIARRYGVSLGDLLSANGLNRSSTIYVGQELMIPGQAPEETNGTMEIEHSGKQVVVVKGDTLGKIAARAGTTVRILKSLNGLTSDTIYVGQKLTIPEGSTVTASPAPVQPIQPAPVPSGSQTYVVQAGDTPSGIARKFGVETSALMAANGISDARKLYVGRTLAIPGRGQSTVAVPPAGTRTVQPRSESATTAVKPAQAVPAEPAAEDPMSILEALEDEDLPFVEVEAVEEPQPGN